MFFKKLWPQNLQNSFQFNLIKETPKNIPHRVYLRKLSFWSVPKARCSGGQGRSCQHCVPWEASVSGSREPRQAPSSLGRGSGRLTRRLPGLRGTLWGTGPAAGTWVSPPDPRPSNRPSRQTCRATAGGGQLVTTQDSPSLLVNDMPVTFLSNVGI